MRRSILLLMVAMAIALGVSGTALAATNSVPDAGTVQTNGRVSAILVAGDRVYLGGFFTHVDGVPRNHLAALDASTGQLTDWNPDVGGQSVRALHASSDGTRVYAGGAFTSVGGVTRKRLAAIDATTSAVDPTWKPSTNSTVRAIAVSGDRVYIGGGFSTVNGQSRARLAQLDATTGALNPAWGPTPNDNVFALGLSGDGTRLYAGGRFTAVNGQTKPYLASVDTSTGALDGAFSPPSPNGDLLDLEVSGERIYTAEAGAGGATAAYDTTTGTRAWMVKGDGDAQAVAVLDEKVYVGGHFDAFGGQSRRKLAAVDKATGALDPQWNPGTSAPGCTSWIPSTCSAQTWALTGDPLLGRLYAGGDFRRISDVAHAGFAQFSQQ